MSTENSPDTVTPIEKPAVACNHYFLPDDPHCLNCDEQIVFPAVKRTRWQNFTAWLGVGLKIDAPKSAPGADLSTVRYTAQEAQAISAAPSDQSQIGV
jgi:hypothetical protein